MAVTITNKAMPEECGKCMWFYHHGITCTEPRYYVDARCELVEIHDDWYGTDPRGGWIGKDISHLPGCGGYYKHMHCVEIGTRAEQCPLMEWKMEVE